VSEELAEAEILAKTCPEPILAVSIYIYEIYIRSLPPLPRSQFPQGTHGAGMTAA
jgi:hypothetical protein